MMRLGLNVPPSPGAICGPSSVERLKYRIRNVTAWLSFSSRDYDFGVVAYPAHALGAYYQIKAANHSCPAQQPLLPDGFNGAWITCNESVRSICLRERPCKIENAIAEAAAHAYPFGAMHTRHQAAGVFMKLLRAGPRCPNMSSTTSLPATPIASLRKSS